jgi:TDG/mug DNA glycosylase family protein
LKDVVRPPVRALFVGINPGIRSSLTGHHFAGYSNRFWMLLHQSGLVPEPIRAEDDVRLPEWGYGVTNLVPRPTAGIDALRPDEYLRGIPALRRKVRRWRPDVVAFVGVTLYRVVFPEQRKRPFKPGLQPVTFEGARLFVLPNPSGRNANYSLADMRAVFRELRRFLRHGQSAALDRLHRGDGAKARRRL